MKGTLRKKSILCILAVIGSTVSTAAQGFSGLGLKLGYTSSVFVGADIPGKGVSSQPGLTLGGFLTYEFNNMLSLQQEVLFTLKGSKVNTIGDVWLSNFFVYTEMPLLVKATFLPEAELRPNVYAGPAFAMLIGAFNEAGLLHDIRSYDVGFVIGIGVDIWKFALDLRLTNGLLNFDESSNGLDRRHQAISFMTGFAF